MMTTQNRIEKVARFKHYELMLVLVSEWAHMKALMGMHFLAVEGRAETSWEIECVHVLPLNGWRARNLAEQWTGKRDSGLLKLGDAKLMQIELIRDLPQWDEVNTRYLAQFTGIVAVEIVAHDNSYGYYMTVSQMQEAEVLEHECTIR